MKGPAYYLADARTQADGLSAPFPILEAGTINHGGDNITVTEADLDNAVQVFQAEQAKGYEAGVDYDHGFAANGDSKAAGWIKQIWREGRKLMARVKWTPIAADQIRSEVYRYWSPEFTKQWTDQDGQRRGFTLLAGALTNRPRLHSLGAVSLSEHPELVRLVGDRCERSAELVDAITATAKNLGITLDEAVRAIDEELRRDAPVDSGRQALHERAQQLERERGITYTEAAMLAAEEG